MTFFFFVLAFEISGGGGPLGPPPGHAPAFNVQYADLIYACLLVTYGIFKVGYTLYISHYTCRNKDIMYM